MMIVTDIKDRYYNYLFFCIKQKKAYEMRISDWSSDVCSSDLPRATVPRCHRAIDDRRGHRSRLGTRQPRRRARRARGGVVGSARARDARQRVLEEIG